MKVLFQYQLYQDMTCQDVLKAFVTNFGMPEVLESLAEIAGDIHRVDMEIMQHHKERLVRVEKELKVMLGDGHKSRVK